MTDKTRQADSIDENLEWSKKSYDAALRGRLVPCRGCGRTFELLRLFRCFHCGSYFCQDCARGHFGDPAWQTQEEKI